MKYTFTILEDGQAEEKKDGMSYKRILKSLVQLTQNGLAG